MEDSSIIIVREGGVTTITFNRPHVMNAIHRPMQYELHEAFNDFSADPKQHICVLRGAGGRAFCAGSDLKYIAKSMRDGTYQRKYPPTGYGGLVDRWDLNKPVIAAVDGVALGGGFEIALACDLILATDRSRFGLTEPLVGAVPLAGGMHRLPRQIGLKRAMELILTSRIVNAEEGYRLGFVNEVVAPDEFDTCISRWTAAILRASPAAIRAAKESVALGLEQASVREALLKQEESAAFNALYASADAREGPLAFAEKRAPVWKD
jgi:crotonobetainyl-CoA hydratase